MIELMFLKESILIRQANYKTAIFVSMGVFLNKWFMFQSYVCNRCHDLLMMSVNLIDIFISKIKNAGYRCYYWN